MSASEQNVVLSVMAQLSSWAPLTFVPRTNEGAFLHIQDDTGNSSSSIGFTGGQVILRIFNWNFDAIVAHEILHALGFRHEHQRHDRNAFVAIVTGNIESGREHNFVREPGALTAGPYDFDSVMHYNQCEFTTCSGCGPGCETILALAPYTANQSSMGQRVGLSGLDVHGLRSLYSRSSWRFVDPAAGSSGTGSGLQPWRQLSSALSSTPSSGTVFVMPNSYAAQGTWSKPMTLEAPVGGVDLR